MPTSSQVVELARLELARISTLGVAGFDTPLSGDAMIEAADALDGLRSIYASAGAGYWRDLSPARRAFDASLAAVHESFARRQAVDEALSLLTDAETGQRGFVLTGDEQFLAPYTFAAQHLDARLHRLAEAAKEDAAESASANAMS